MSTTRSVKWLVENYNDDPKYKVLMEEVVRQGMKCIEIKYISFESGVYDQIENTSDECVLFYGSLNLGRQLLREKKWVPGVWCNLENFRCASYYPRFYKHLLNKDSVFIPRGILKERISYLYDQMGVDNCLFIRPDSGFKEFAGRVVPNNEFDSDYKWMEEFCSPSSMVVVSSPKIIEAEWRFFVGPNGVISGCTSKTNNKTDFKDGYDYLAVELANEISKSEWKPDPLFVVDICKSGGEYLIMEFNSFSCSGIYDCDPEPIVREASKFAIEECESYKNLTQSC